MLREKTAKKNYSQQTANTDSADSRRGAAASRQELESNNWVAATLTRGGNTETRGGSNAKRGYTNGNSGAVRVVFRLAVRLDTNWDIGD